MARISFNSNLFAPDGRLKLGPAHGEPIGGDVVLKRVCQPHSGRSDPVVGLEKWVAVYHAGAVFGLSRSMRHRILANRSREMATSAIWKVT